MKITLIACSDKNNIIGINNNIPWNCPVDMNFFKNYTINKTVVMGAKTFESLNFTPLKNRECLILSTTLTGENVFSSKESLLEFLSLRKITELVIMGGSSIYELFLEDAEKIILNQVNIEVEFNEEDEVSHFPDFDKTKYIKNTFFQNEEVTFNTYRKRII